MSPGVGFISTDASLLFDIRRWSSREVFDMIRSQQLMSDPESLIYLARHGETVWSITGQHTGLTDLPLTTRGERNASQLGQRLKGLKVSHVFVSPLQRARQTCDLAGFGTNAQIDEDLVEWNYGHYEGLTGMLRS